MPQPNLHLQIHITFLISAICENAQESNNWRYGKREKQKGGLFLLTAA